MFEDIRVLLITSDKGTEQVIRSVLTSYTFSVTVVDDARDAIDAMEQCDIMVLDLELANGFTDLLMKKWATHRKCFMMTLLSQGPDMMAVGLNAFRQGAWNVILHPLERDVIGGLLRNYGTMALIRRRYDTIDTEIAALKAEVSEEVTVLKAQLVRWQRVTVAAVLVAIGVGGGPQLWTLISSLW